MSKATRYDAIELVISIPTERGSHVRCTSAGTVKEQWEAGSGPSLRAASQRADTIEKAIVRTLGPYEDECRAVQTRTVSEAVCEHCGSTWTEVDPKYNGGCCARDEEANPENVRAAE